MIWTDWIIYECFALINVSNELIQTELKLIFPIRQKKWVCTKRRVIVTLNHIYKRFHFKSLYVQAYSQQCNWFSFLNLVCYKSIHFNLDIYVKQSFVRYFFFQNTLLHFTFFIYLFIYLFISSSRFETGILKTVSSIFQFK